ncbi:phospho-sugar mutase [Parenemella sanctibonifatiensis]|uniref:Phosphomannomutase n=1 Tax=Parenemella sanctibonifatiensis TaxID=2016505 RepID=A0A255E9E5_9ACTN|nr:phospho-sugar mutase [Parenemella sanctibonifatiensis]OYN87900.1 phosphomannomutase [Parenemella sanctibonifatiensis]
MNASPAPLADPALQARVDAWLAAETDEGDAGRLRSLVRAACAHDPEAQRELVDAFAGDLTFGTAGLRGPLGPGPNRMNSQVVTRAAAGLAAWLTEQHPDDHGQLRVVIGHDHRHRSADFAAVSAEVLAGAGFEVIRWDRAVPTPLLASAIRRLGAAAGIMVTASHNPAPDNGYKVYLADGRQLVAPMDEQIADRIRAVGPVTGLPRTPVAATPPTELAEAYLTRAISQLAVTETAVRWAYTPVHGVGAPLLTTLAHRSDFPAPALVASQLNPDPDFGNLPFPNPEEPGVMDAVIAQALQVDADIALANDPDADRLGAAIPDAGGWRRLTGDEIGLLLAADALERGVHGTYAASLVSGTVVGDLARSHGQPYATTLTGFKWIARVPGLVFGYEEALGFCCDPGGVADKDGITAAVALLALTARTLAAGATVAERLAALEAQYGPQRTSQIALRVTDLATITTLMRRLRGQPPGQVAETPLACTDHSTGTAELPPTDALEFTGGPFRVIVRPSGTEAKLKCYLQVRHPAGTPGAVADEDLRRLTAAVHSWLADD